MAFSMRVRVRYAECDTQGVVFNARYGDYVDLAATEFMRAAIGGYDQLLAKGFDNQVVKLLTEWRAPARFDEVLILNVRVDRIGNTSFTLVVDMERESGGGYAPIARSEVVYVVIDRQSGDKCTVPDFLRAGMKAIESESINVDQSLVAQH